MDMGSLQEDIDSKDIVVDVLKREGSFLEKISTKPALGKSNQNDFTAFEYSIWADLGEDFIFVPHDSGYWLLFHYFVFCNQIVHVNQNVKFPVLLGPDILLRSLVYLHYRLLYLFFIFEDCFAFYQKIIV